MRNYLLMVIMTLGGAVGGFFFKRASASATSIAKLLKNPNLYIGGFIYVTTALLNIYVLKLLPYTVVLPFTAITYIWTFLLANRLLGEKITRNKLIGIAAIALGVTLLALSQGMK